ncbi:MAG: CDP-diacylglycerol--serine O-phosphatidyltransferase [Candidatus Kapabacteria bacterium]|nr:CDP-diacylglycerol--serine O-phosphatidyltransferase [Candidatus Kapabacteria bacterium]
MRVTRSVIPNLFTLANLFCGFAAIVAAVEHRPLDAALFILGSGVFDMLDGIVARITHSTSEFGVELDSLCDAVSFGVAPGMLLYVEFFSAWHQWGLLLASLPALAGVLRLARFNVQLTSMEDKLYFRGMPIPAGAFTIVSYIVFWYLPLERGLAPMGLHLPATIVPWLTTAVTVLTAGAMVSTIKYDNLPRPSMRSIRQRPVVFLVFLGGIAASAITAGTAVFPFMMLYMIGGAIRHAVLAFSAARADADDTLEEPDADPFEL